MRRGLIFIIILALAVMCGASKCTIGDKTLPQKGSAYEVQGPK